VCVLCALAGGTFTCAGALVMTAAGSNVRIDLTSITLTGGATVDLTSCTPTQTALPSVGSPWVLDPSVSGDTSVTCSINNPTLLQNHFDASSVSWDVTVGAAAKGSNSTINADYTATYTKALTQVRQYQLGIKRMDLNGDSGTAAVTTAGKMRPSCAVSISEAGGCPSTACRPRCAASPAVSLVVAAGS
jgi:hypothetical protein